MTLHVACNDAMMIPSLDGIIIAMHDFGGEGSPVLLSHATGFHAHCWEPMAQILSVSHHVMGFDHRGYGDAETVDPATIEWQQYGNDALAAARHLSAQHDGQPIVGIGHSMGGASLLMAALQEPSLFSALFVFEPIVFPPAPENEDRPSSPLAGGARKRRSTFPNFEAALENFTAKPPMASFHPVAREAYVRHGFKPNEDGEVELKCLPEHEARTYETGGTHSTWGDLANISTRVWVLSGAPAPFQPSSFAIKVAENIPGSTYVQFDEMGHFGPLEHPAHIASLVENTIATF
ncbi:MAG: alpha/beta fold hydrolase [Actinobacteria bacterium]|nr:alpha/beta fold hydrolase [Actinomycetota bacterium]